MNHDAYPDSYIREILSGVKSIAMVGASPVNVRPSYFAFKYLAQRGYDMIPVNPGHVGKSLLDKPFVASAAKAEAAGLKVVMNRCPKIEYGRLSSEISWMGVNSRTLSSKRAPVPTQGMRLSLNRMSVGGGETAASDRAAKNKSELP